jgi:pilus assembly protein CpaC
MQTQFHSSQASPAAAKRRFAGRGGFLKLLWLVLLICGWLIQSAWSQNPPPNPPEPLISGFRPHVPPIPANVPAAPERFKAATSFIDSMSKNDAMFEVVLGQGRLIVLKDDLVRDVPRGKAAQPLIAIGNPEITDFEVLGPRQIRVLGKKIGVTDLVVTDVNNNTYSFEVHVVYDLTLLQARIRQLFPDAQVRLAQLGKNLVVEGQARDMAQIRQIVQLVQRGILLEGAQGGTGATAGAGATSQPAASPSGNGYGDQGASGGTDGPEIINLMHVPGPQQVLLKVQFAEMNRTAMRQVGIDSLFSDGNGTILGTKINATTLAGGPVTAFPQVNATASGLFGSAGQGASAATTAFGIFDSVGYQAMLSIMRQNSMFKVLAEPNLVTMNGHEAHFLAGGQFPVPVPQSGAGGGAATITIQYKPFGVALRFIPFIIDGDTIRLSVDPEVSSVDFSLGIQLSGTSVPGLNVRNAHTVVELKEGQTLAIAGLMALSINGNTNRIPGLGDLPFIGPFFSNTTSQTIDKELVVLVTPYLVEPMNCDEVPQRPGDEVYEPNDLEFYLLGRLQGRTGHREFRSTTNYDDPLNLVQRLNLESRTIQGPHGFSD